MASREKVDDVFWRTKVTLHPYIPEPHHDEWADPTFEEVEAKRAVGRYAQRLEELRVAEQRRRRDRARLQRVQRPGLHNLDFGRCAGSFTQVKGKRWLQRAREMNFSGDEAPCKWCYTMIPLSYKTGKLIGHTPTGLYGKAKHAGS